MSQAHKLLYVFTQAPYSNAAGLEALDAVLIGASFEQDVSVLFLENGVFQLLNGQNTQSTGIKQFTKTFKVLADFGVEHCYAHDLSLQARGLEQSQLMIDTQVLSSEQVRSLIAEQHRVFTF